MHSTVTGEPRVIYANVCNRGLITNLLNPKAGIFYIAMVPTFVTAGTDRAPGSGIGSGSGGAVIVGRIATPEELIAKVEGVTGNEIGEEAGEEVREPHRFAALLEPREQRRGTGALAPVEDILPGD